MEIEHRTILEISDLEIRETDGQHHIVALVAPWNATYDAGTSVERFGKSVFDKSIKERGTTIPLMHGHDRENMPIGKSSTWEKDAVGLVADFEVAPAERAREALRLRFLSGIRAGTQRRSQSRRTAPHHPSRSKTRPRSVTHGTNRPGIRRSSTYSGSGV